ncbi:MAG: OmpA family protein [Bacteroidales bacterium]|nr:OmpA family protein [Bacteroidales bacterium]
MKKIIIASAAALALAGTANAEFAPLTPSKPFDNYSITLKGGVVSPMWNPAKDAEGKHITFGRNMRGIAGLEVRKQITPSLGLGIEGEAMFNTSTFNHAPSMHNIVDQTYVGGFGAINLNNLFAGYAGQPRLFEVEAVAGIGWLHGFKPASEGNDIDDLATKFGVNFNFNLGEEKAWTVGIKPSVLYDISNHGARLNRHRAVGQIEAGVTYHFGNSNGTHSFTFQPAVDLTPYNDQINALRAENAALAAANADVVAANAALAAKLDECINKPVPVVTNTVVEQTNTLESIRYVYYRIGSSTIAADQKPNVEMIADYMKHNPSSTVVVKGYASKDGNLDFNLKLAAKRAEAVKTMLVSKYGIKADRIKAEGEGIGNMFKEESWNRVAICILNEAE